ncbi:hypothetical protein KY290_008354 [Solanum tuberosum]|uniref:Uncharacterized protein n=1 Tax=Solanum tuberosum TaxID=4113 RepID=A0ABQ7W875_SOLTU|nr:hypothetical protein KY284_008282 [Solanum tuberosum]KAH0776943.1 hypothetical protein KY290_008354 [Solanum tuberosum]
MWSSRVILETRRSSRVIRETRRNIRVIRETRKSSRVIRETRRKIRVSPDDAPGFQTYPDFPPGFPNYPTVPPGFPNYPAALPGFPNYPDVPPGFPNYPVAPLGFQNYPAAQHVSVDIQSVDQDKLVFFFALLLRYVFLFKPSKFNWLKRQEECLVKRQHRREEILANKEACRLRKEAPEREIEEKNQHHHPKPMASLEIVMKKENAVYRCSSKFSMSLKSLTRICTDMKNLPPSRAYDFHLIRLST